MSSQSLKIYDPFYCDGRTKVLLRKLGYESVIHEKRDFYADVKKSKVPLHQVFMTNPPYSDDHKEKLFNYVCERYGVPFLLLLPSYVASKGYYRKIVQCYSDRFQFFYVVPNVAYEYDHPEGTGKPIPPFFSIWFCGLPRSMDIDIQSLSDTNTSTGIRITSSLNELEEWEIITTKNRMNPKQRKKYKNKMKRDIDQEIFESESSDVIVAHHDQTATNRITPHITKSKVQVQGRKKKSKHRDENGNRKKRRF